MKKIYLMTSIVLTSALLLSACGSKKDETKPIDKATESSQVVTSSEVSLAQVAETTVQATDAPQAVEETSTVAVQAEAAIPAEVLGTWTGSSDQAKEVTFTISADGTFVTSQDFDNGLGLQETTAQITKLVQYDANTYFITEFTGDWSTLLPGITGLGGSGGVLVPGFRIENGTYTPLGATGTSIETTDFSNAHGFGNVSYTR